MLSTLPLFHLEFWDVPLGVDPWCGPQRVNTLGFSATRYLRSIPSYVTMMITASQFLDKPHNASAVVACSCNCESVAISHYISETMQASKKVTTECEYEVISNLSDGVVMTLSDREHRFQGHGILQRLYLKTAHLILSNCKGLIYITSSVMCRWRTVPRQ